MTDWEARERDMLRNARRGLSPSGDAEGRILAATLASVALGAVSAEGSPSPATAAPLQARLARYAIGALALGVAGFGGYGWGYRAGAAAQAAPPRAAATRVVQASPVVEPQKERLPADPPPLTPRSDAAPAPLPRRNEPQLGSESGKSNVVAPLASSTSPGDVGLDEEVRQLRRIERAVRDGNPRLALVLAEDLERAIPNGQLMIERSAATMMADCQLGSETAAPRASRFIEQNPSSPYAARLREVCRLPSTEQRK